MSRARASRRRRAGGFTLLEVMAAVSLLAILYTVLARVAIEGLRAEGESVRRLEASLLADLRLGDAYDWVHEQGAILPLGRSETIEGDFTIALEVTPFQPPAEWGVTGGEGVTPMIFAAAAGAPGVDGMRTAQLTISWHEGVEERHVSRTVYFVDFVRAAARMDSANAAARSREGNKAPDAPEGVEAPSELNLERELGSP